MNNCPYCLYSTASFLSDNKVKGYRCPECKQPVPRDYVDKKNIPRANIGLVGFSGHGKTVYLTSLFSNLGKLTSYWGNFYFRSLDDYTHKILYEHVPMFDKGILPDSTPANFPNPALIFYKSLPNYGDCFLNFYDTAGEVFSDSDQITRAGFFVAQSNVALFIISIKDCNEERLDEDLCKLLDVYVRSVYDRMNIKLKERQNLIVVFTKSDLIADQLPSEFADWLKDGNINWYGLDLRNKIIEIEKFSVEIDNWLRIEKKCSRFLNLAQDSFVGIRFTLISAMGFDGQNESHESLRVLDPFLLMLKNAKPINVDNELQKSSWWRKLLRI